MLLPAVNAQEVGRLSKAEIKKFQKEQKKADQEAEAELAAELTRYMVNNHKFVLEADYLSDRYGNRIQVSSMINFIRVDSTQGVMQLGNAYSVGYNGVGGSTVEGRVSNYEAKRIGKKKDAWSVSMIMQTTLGSFNINLMINAGGRADANIKSNWPGQINYHGDLVPISQSRTYKGSPSY